MNNLLKVIFKLLKESHERVFHDEAPNDAVFPYLVFNIDNSFRTHRDDIILIIDIWDKNSSSMDIEDIADKLEISLNNKNVANDDLLATFFISQRFKVEEEDKQLKRRQLRFEIQTYFTNRRY